MPALGRDPLSLSRLAKSIDHSLLRPELTRKEVLEGCELARRYEVAAACVRPCDVDVATQALAGSDVSVCTVVGFPHGSSSTATKASEARLALEQGAQELDMVINVGWLRSGEDELVREDIAAIVRAAGDRIVKVILENAYLTDEEKVRGCRLTEHAGAGYVKTSTGFAASGSTIEDLRLMRASVSPGVGVKAAGGIRTLAAMLEALSAGATRIGATATERMLEDFKAGT